MAQQAKQNRGKRNPRPKRNRGKVGKKIAAILKDLKEDPIDGVEIELKDDDMYMWDVAVKGPDESWYSGGTFHIHIKFNSHFPLHPPGFKMETPIYHMNVNKKGMICLDKISAWNQKNTIREILNDFVELLIRPSTNDQLVYELAALYQFNEKRYIENAQKCTQMFATGPNEHGVPFSMDMFNNDPTDDNNNNDNNNNNSNNNNNNNNNNNGENKDDNDDGKENEDNKNKNENENEINANQNSSENEINGNNGNNGNNENGDNIETSNNNNNNNNNSNDTNINDDNENKNGDDS